MTAIRWTALLLPATLALAPLACGPDKPTTPPTTGPVASGDGGEDGATPDEPALDPGPPQEPDPAEIAQGRHEVLLGHYQAAIDLLNPVYDDLKTREQFHASGMAGAWLAVAHAQIVFENAEEPATHAAAMADRTGDAGLLAAAKLARGSILLAEGDAAAASQALVAAAAAEPTSVAAALALVYDGEALIGTAFGGGRAIINPGHLDEAKEAYNNAATAAPGTGDEADALLGRADEGLAAIADYQKDKDATCKHAFASIDHYKAAGAADFLVSGPSELASKRKCKP